MKRARVAATWFAACALTSGLASANTVNLNNGPGDGSVQITLDGYGSFGSAIGGEGDEAIYDPVGALEAEGTTFESALLIGLGGGAARTALSTGSPGTGTTGTANLPSVSVSQNGNTATSFFSQLGLNFNLTQTLSPLFDASDNRTGSVLVQTYSMTNPGTVDINGLELVRYIDGDLVFGDPTFNNDGGGRLIADGTEILFETDEAMGTSDATTFFGITGEGGIIPGSGRFEASEYSELIEKLRSGGNPNDTVQGDTGDADQFVDAGEGYDITLAFRNLFNIAAGGTATYTTRTIFGSGAPEDVVTEPPPGEPPPPPPGGVIPLPAGVWGGLALLSAIGGTSSLKRFRRRRP